MVSTAAEYDFSTVIDGFFALKKFDGRHGDSIKIMVRTRATQLLTHPDVRYMPAFKILDLLASLVNIAVAVADAPQLRINEARALIRESLSDTAPVISQFMLDATLERVRYEPMMLTTIPADAAAERSLLLQQRWAAMRAAHHERYALPDSWLDAIDTAVDAALAAPEFQHYRQGPLLQFFSEMLGLARTLHRQQATLTALQRALGISGALWKRYALKSARYEEKQAFTQRDAFPQTAPSHVIH